jgi:hypothetical protein
VTKYDYEIWYIEGSKRGEDLKATVDTPDVAIHGESGEEVKGGSDNWTQSGNLENLGNSTTKAIRASKTWGTLQLKQSEHLKE